MKPSDNKIPKHIGIILDGNRRFAKKLMIKPWKGHEWGAKKLENLLGWSKELGIKELTLYAFSMQNFNRPKNEFDYLMKIFKDNVHILLKDPRAKEIKVNIIGRIYLFPEDVQKDLREVMEKTKDNKRFILNIALAYGGREELIDAVRKIGEQIKKGEIDIDKINEETFSKNLYMSDEPELIIRTGGEKRTSNFLSYQSAYSEWIFLDKMWPEFEKEDFIECLNEYSKRQRRFGR